MVERYTNKSTRRSALKKIAFGGASLSFPITVADRGSATGGQDPSTSRCGGGGRTDIHVRNSSVRSRFPEGKGQMFSSAGSTYGQASDIVWNGEYWTVDFHTWAYAANAYELDNGRTGVEPIYRGQHRVQVDMETKPRQVSTQPYDDVDWGISVIGQSETYPGVDKVAASAAKKIMSNMSEGVGSLVTAVDIYNQLEKASVGADIDKTWVPYGGQRYFGHYLRWTHTYPPREELGETVLYGTITNKLTNSLYKPEIEWTGNREPTEQYDHTFNYSLPVGGRPDKMTMKAGESNMIEKRPAREVNNSNIDASGDEEVYVLRSPQAKIQGGRVC